MYVRLRSWRAAHPEASFDEIGDQVTQERQRLMAGLLGSWRCSRKRHGWWQSCASSCGQELTRKGKRKRTVGHLEGEVPVEREYHYCDECQSGLFPPGRQTEVDRHAWRPGHD